MPSLSTTRQPVSVDGLAPRVGLLLPCLGSLIIKPLKTKKGTLVIPWLLLGLVVVGWRFACVLRSSDVAPLHFPGRLGFHAYFVPSVAAFLAGHSIRSETTASMSIFWNRT